MAAKKSAALDFTRQYLREKPEASFAEIRDAGAEQDLKIYPIVFGRAKALEGLVKVAPYGSKKRAKEAAKAQKAEQAEKESAAAAGAGAGAGAGTGATRSGDATVDSIKDVITGMRENHADRERYRAALIKISEILDDVL